MELISNTGDFVKYQENGDDYNASFFLISIKPNSDNPSLWWKSSVISLRSNKNKDYIRIELSVNDRGILYGITITDNKGFIRKIGLYNGSVYRDVIISDGILYRNRNNKYIDEDGNVLCYIEIMNGDLLRKYMDLSYDLDFKVNTEYYNNHLFPEKIDFKSKKKI